MSQHRTTTIPFLDLQTHHREHREAFNRAISEVIDCGAFAGGPYVEKFEKEFADYCGVSHAVAVGNGTDSLWLPLLALGVGPGDEVITVPATFIATAEAITYCGAKPVFVDIDPKTYGMDPALLEAAITPRTKAILPVHLFGQPVDMDPILKIAAAHGLPVVEDAAQAHGARYHGRRAGSLGIAGSFSFYPGKNLGAFGEGGAVVTNDAALASKVRMYRDHGQAKKYYHDVVGWNCRMDGIQGAVLSIKLPWLDERNAARRRHAGEYHQALQGVPGLILPVCADGVESVWHIYSVRVPDRDRILEGLTAAGIGCGIHYPVPVHRQKAYAGLDLGEGTFPVSEQCAREFLSLPMFPELTTEQINVVASTLKGLLAGGEPQADSAPSGTPEIAAALR